MNQISVRPAPLPLPATREDLAARRKVYHEPTLNDRVNAIHEVLWENSQYRGFLDAVYDEDAVEGSLTLDSGEAAGMIRDYAREHSDTYVASKKKATIVKSLNVVLKRYGIGRKERAREVAGELIDSKDNGAE